MAAMTPGLRAQRVLERLLQSLLLLLVVAAEPVWAGCKNFSLSATTPVAANGLATSAIRATYSKSESYTTTLTITGSALFNNGLQTFTQTLNKDSPINITATNTVAQTVTVTMSNSTCTQSKTIVFANAAPTVSTSFSPATIGVNGTSTKTITLTNPNSVALTGAAFNDSFPAGLKIASPLTTSNTCGGTLTASAGGSSLTLSGGTIPANGSCSVTSSVTPTSTGTKTNRTGSVTSSNGLTASAASANLTVQSVSTTLSTAVAEPTTVAADGLSTSVITVTLRDGAGSPVSGKAITVTRFNSTNNTITPASGTTNASGVATFTVNASAAQTVSYRFRGDGVTLLAEPSVVFTAVQPIAKIFTPPTVPLNGTSTLSIVLTNTRSTSRTNQSFSDTYPSGLVNAEFVLSSLTGPGCTGILAGLPGFGFFGLTGATIPATTTCTASISVRPTATGSLLNTVSGSAGSASATLTVLPISDANSTVVASPTTVAADGTTTSTITVTLRDGASTPNGVANKTVELTATGGSSVVTTVSATTNASGVATFTVRNSVAEGPIFYTARDVTDAITLTDTADVTFTDMLAPTVSTSFSPSTIGDGGTSTLTITLSNPNAAAIRDVAFTDTYPAGLVNDSPLVLSNTCGGATPSTVADGNVLRLVGGIIPASGSCSVSIAVTNTTTTTGASATLTNATGAVTSINANDGASASATLTTTSIDAVLSTAVASPTSIEANGTTTSTITVTMLDGSGAGVSDLAVTLTPSGGTSVITGPTSTNANLTDENGQVTFTVKASTPQTVTYTARNTTNGINVTQQPQVVFTTPSATVTAITCATACTQTAASSSVSWNVTFSRSVTNVTAAAFSLVASGLTGSSITSVTGSGTNWVVTANVGSGTGTLGLNQTGAGTVSPTLTGTFTGQVYTTPTLVTAITCATACTQTSITSSVSWTVTFNRSVSNVTSAAFSLAATGLSGSAITSVTGSGTTWTVTADVGTGAGTLGLNQTGAGTVSPALGGTFTGQVYTTPATVVTAISCTTACTQTAVTSTVQWTVTFNRSVSNVTSAAFGLVATGLTGSSIASVSGSGTTWTVTANVGTGAGTLGLNQTGAGTVSPTLTGTFTGQVYTTPTLVTAITCATACTQTSITSSVSWTVTFNRSVSSVTSAAFSLAATGLTGSSITSVTGSGTTWTVTADVGTGAGTLGLNQTGAGTVSPALTGTFTGQVYTTPATVVTAITCATACTQTSITSSVSWTVTFNRSVSNVTSAAFGLAATGLTGSAITSVTGSGTTWTVTADVGTGAGTLGLNQTGAGTVSPALTGTFTGQVYTTPATVVTAITCATACTQTSITSSVSWTVTFNRSVSNVTAAAFGLVANGLTGSAITTVSGSGTSWTVTADVGTGAGTLGLNQTGAGTVSPALTGTFTGQVYTTPATVVTAITCTTACTQTSITSTVSWNVTFNRSVTNVTAAAFGLVANGLTGSAITTVSGSGTSWTVTANVGTGAGTLGLNQTGAGTVSPTLTGTFTGQVYTTVPTAVTAISCASTCVQTSITSTVSWTVTFNRSVTGVDASAFGLVATGLSGSAITTVSGSGTSWTVTASVGTGAGTLGLNQTGSGTVSPALSGTFTGEVYTTPPTVVTAITCATACTQTAITATVSWSVTFNRSVTGVDASAFGLVATGLSGSAITTVSGSGTSWTVTANVGTGAGTLGLNQTGPGTVSPALSGTFTGEVYTTPPTVVTAITCATACTQTSITTTVSWSVTFNRSVTGVDASAFGLVATGLSGSAITTVSGSGTSWTVTANVGTGAGTLGLNQTGAGTVSPTLIGTFTGEVYTTPPTVVTAITCATACTQTSITTTVSWNVTFNRSVSNVTSAAFGLVATGLTGSSITTVSGSGTSWTVTANVGTGAGTLGLNQTGSGTVSPVLTGTFTGEVYTTPATVVTAITCATACTQTAITATVSWNVTFNRSVSNVTSAAFGLVTSGLSGSAITTVSGSGSSWTVTANVGTGAGTLRLNQTGAGTVSPTLTGTFTGEVYTTPATAVTAISCASACAQSTITSTVSWSVSFNRSVTGVSASAFSLAATGLTGSAITSVTGSGTSWTVTANVGTGSGTLGLNQSGPGSVSPALSGTFTGEVYITPTATVTAITCASTCTQATTASTVAWTVTFSRSVTGVSSTAFSLVSTGLSGASIAAVTGSGTTWTVTAILGVGSGTLGLNQTGAGAVSPPLTGSFTGQVYTLLTASATAIYRFDETSWNGTAAQVLDSSGNGNHAQAISGATTAITNPTPAISGATGTCRYGVMTGTSVTNGSVRTPLPNLTTNFTVAAWIYSTNAATAGQRIFTDDAAGTTGYGFSLGDSGSAKLRFFSRGVNPVILDSTYTLSSNTWYFVAAVADITNRTRTIYVFSSTGALLASTSVAHTGTWGTDAGAVQIGTSQSGFFFKGNIDEVQVYPRALSQTAIASLATQTHECPVIAGPDHFQISHGGTGVTCTASAVTLSAHNADHSVFSGYTGTATLSTSVGRGDWTLVTGSGTLANGTANDGAATYTFGASDNGTVTLGFQDTTAETLSLNAADGGLSETGGSASAATDDPSITFATTGFEFRANGVANAIGTQIAGKSSATAPGAQSLQIRAIRSSDSSTACVAALQGSRTVQFGYECVSPASCSASSMSLNGGSSTTIAGNPSGSVGSYTNTTMTFDGSGLASFNVTWNDAGSARLYARYPLPLASGAASGNFMAGSSNAFVSRPFAYQFSVTGNAAASTAAGSKFLAAGTTFNGTARAVAWSAADDTNNDGIADGMDSGDTNAANNADLSGNATTPNFSPSTSITLNSNLLLPAGGTHPGITGSPVAAFSNGVAAISGMRYDEAGIIEISAVQGGSYLGLSTTETAKIRGNTGYVGRFHPKRLGVAANAPAFSNACSAGAFTYQGQPFYFGTAPVLSLTALSAQGTTTANYTTTGFFKLSSTLAGRSYADATGGGRTLSVVNGSAAVIAGSTGGTGIATLSLASGSGGDAFTYTRAAPESPFAASVTANFTAADLTDSDGICLDSANDGVCDTFSIAGLSGANMRYGRLVVENAMGSELTTLRVPLYTQYYNNGGFVLNTADVCSVVPSTALDFGAGTPAGLPAAGVLSFPISTGTSTATLTGTAVAGQFGLLLSAPGSGKTGEINLQLNMGTAGLPWLQYDWNGDGSGNDDPTARATFGTFQGPKRVIFKREVW